MDVLPEFALERWFARWEFTARWNLSASDVEGMRLDELLALTDPDTRELWDDLALGYTESAGHPLLRAEIAELHTTIGPDDVLVCAGAEEAILLLATALAGPGDAAACVVPAYQSLHEVARGAGAEVRTVALDPSRGWALDPGEWAAAADGARMAVVNFPHNPTGALPGAEEFRRIVAAGVAGGGHLVSDEVYRLLEHDPDDRLPAAADLHERAVSVGVMSKAFGLAGLRIGWIATRDRDLLARVARLKDYTTICASAPSEVLAICALRARERVLERARGIVLANLGAVAAFAAAHADRITWEPPRAGTVGFPRVAVDGPVEEWAGALARDHGVLLLPGTVFGDHPDRVRIGLGRRDLPAGLDALGRALG